MKRLESLTDEQVKLMDVVRDEWIQALDKPSPANREVIVAGVKWLYKFCKLEDPRIVIVQSPLAAQIAANILSSPRFGDQVWDQVWDQVGAQVRDQVGAQVRDQVGAQVRDQVWAQVWAQVGDQVRAQVWDQVRDQVRDQVGAQVWAQVGAQVWAQVRDQVGAQKNKFFTFASYGSVYDFCWLAFYDFFERIGITHKVEAFASFRTLMQAGVYDMVQLQGVCIVSEMPTEIHRDSQGRLHNTEGPAITFADGYHIHSLWGVRFQPDEFAAISDMPASKAVTLANMEQRMAVLRLMGPEKLLAELDSTQIHSDMGYELYEVNSITPGKTQYCLKYSCPSTDRVYVSFVKPEIGQKRDAVAAIASKWNLSREQYLEIRFHS